MEDSDFAHDLDLLREEAQTAIDSFYTWLTLNNQLSSKKELYQKLNRNPSFWNIILHSLQVTFFISLGKIFDKSRKAHSLEKLVIRCMDNPAFFSKAALAKRRMTDNIKPDWLDEFLLNAFEPSRMDLKVFDSEISKLKTFFDPTYKMIRDEVIAHTQLKDSQHIAQLYSNTQIGEIEKLLYGIYDLLNCLWELWQNGRKPSFGNKTYGYKERVSKTTGNVLNMF